MFQWWLTKKNSSCNQLFKWCKLIPLIIGGHIFEILMLDWIHIFFLLFITQIIEFIVSKMMHFTSISFLNKKKFILEWPCFSYTCGVSLCIDSNQIKHFLTLMFSYGCKQDNMSHTFHFDECLFWDILKCVKFPCMLNPSNKVLFQQNQMFEVQALFMNFLI
jgi:hypothetical protein